MAKLIDTIDYLQKNGPTTLREMCLYFNISKQAMYQHINKLWAQDKLIKTGHTPKVYYSLKPESTDIPKIIQISNQIKETIEKNYLYITSAGKRMDGLAGFEFWCRLRNLTIEKTAQEYANTLQKYSVFKKDGLIDGKIKLQTSFEKLFLDEIYYLDFYSIERFGKTKLGQLLLYAKQSQDRYLMREIVDTVKPYVENLITKYNIDGIGFIPPTVQRKMQLMDALSIGLIGNRKKLNIIKVNNDLPVPQKSLNKLEDRIENARKTIIIKENAEFNNILLIDDAVGSGATLNETANKIRERNICKGKIIGLALTGSFKGFDVVNEI